MEKTCSYWQRQQFRDADDRGFGTSPYDLMTPAQIEEHERARAREDEAAPACGDCEDCAAFARYAAEFPEPPPPSPTACWCGVDTKGVERMHYPGGEPEDGPAHLPRPACKGCGMQPHKGECFGVESEAR